MHPQQQKQLKQYQPDPQIQILKQSCNDIMQHESRNALAEFLQEKLHDSLPGHYFGSDEVLDHINNFFKVQDLIMQRDALQQQIDALTK